MDKIQKAKASIANANANWDEGSRGITLADAVCEQQNCKYASVYGDGSVWTDKNGWLDDDQTIKLAKWLWMNHTGK